MNNMDEQEQCDDASNQTFWDIIGLYDETVRCPRARVFQCRIDPFTLYDHEEFRLRYRLTKQCFNNILIRVHDRLIHASNRSGLLPPILQLLIGVRFFASGSFQVSCRHNNFSKLNSNMKVQYPFA